MKKNKSIKKKISMNMFTSQYVYVIIMMVLFITLLLFRPSMWYVTLILFAIVSIFTFFVVKNEFINRATRVSEIEKSISKVMKNTLNDIQIPMMVLTKKDELIWTNKSFSFVITPEDLEKLLIQIDSKTNTGSYILEFGENSYEVYTNLVEAQGEVFKLLSFVDKTEEKNMRLKIKEDRMCVGTLVVDNYEDILQGLDNTERINLTTQIDSEIRKWGKLHRCIVSKNEKDKYTLLFKTKDLEEIKSKEFEILDKIRNISKGTKIPASLSIGISSSEENLVDRYNASLSAIDIALGRGGDQVVVKENGKYEFYGDSTIKLEKMSKVRSRTIAQATRDLIEKSDKVYVVGHKNSDIDCIGAAVGLYKIAEKFNKPVNIIMDVKYNSSSKMIIEKLKKDEKYEEVFVTKEDVKKVDFTNALLIIVDTHRKSYLAAPDILDDFDNVILVDHHRRGPEFIDNTILSYHEVYASSTSELVTELLMYFDDIELTQSEAEAMYGGILVDTKNFTFKTGVRTFEAAAYLKRVGLDISEVKQIFQNDFKTYTAKTDIVRDAEFIDENIAISVCDKTMDNLSVIAAQAADELLAISEVAASFVLCEVDNVVMISGRSMGDINVQTILEKLGGGGHLTVAGAQMSGVDLQEAKENLIEAIESYKTKEI